MATTLSATAGWLACQLKLREVSRSAYTEASANAPAPLLRSVGWLAEAKPRAPWPGFARFASYAAAVFAAARQRLVGGDGFEPPAPSV